MAWVWLGVAGLFEVVWAVLLKYTDGFMRLVPSLATVAAMAVSFYCMSRALQVIPIGTLFRRLDRHRRRRRGDLGHGGGRRPGHRRAHLLPRPDPRRRRGAQAGELIAVRATGWSV